MLLFEEKKTVVIEQEIKNHIQLSSLIQILKIMIIELKTGERV